LREPEQCIQPGHGASLDRWDRPAHCAEIMPRKPVKQKADDSHWYIEDDLWLDLLRPLIADDDAQAERAARLFHRLAKELKENGPDGAYRVRCCLENARRVVFPFTRFAHDCEMLFRESSTSPIP
jgi:hypothetical protein